MSSFRAAMRLRNDMRAPLLSAVSQPAAAK